MIQSQIEGPWEPVERVAQFPTYAEYGTIGNEQAVTALAFHERLPVLFAGSQDGAIVRIELETKRSALLDQIARRGLRS